VLASPREVQEVRNAFLAYDRVSQWRPSDEAHLLEAHGVLMAGLVERPGAYCSGGVGVMAGETLVHMAPPADRVPLLLGDLLGWLSRSTDHALLRGSLYHCELEFIHPFADGNGRMGRLWQTLILSRWRPLFADLPIETLVHAHQGDYDQAIQDNTDQGTATPFLEFMLRMICAADELESMSATLSEPIVKTKMARVSVSPAYAAVRRCPGVPRKQPLVERNGTGGYFRTTPNVSTIIAPPPVPKRYPSLGVRYCNPWCGRSAV